MRGILHFCSYYILTYSRKQAALLYSLESMSLSIIWAWHLWKTNTLQNNALLNHFQTSLSGNQFIYTWHQDPTGSTEFLWKKLKGRLSHKRRDIPATWTLHRQIEALAMIYFPGFFQFPSKEPWEAMADLWDRGKTLLSLGFYRRLIVSDLWQPIFPSLTCLHIYFC